MSATDVPALPGLTSIGKKTADDAAVASLSLVPVKRDLSTLAPDGWRALEHLPEGKDETSIRADAVALAISPDLNQVSFVQFTKEYEVDATPAVDNMLANVKARDAGEAGKRVVMITTRARKFGNGLPKPSEKFMEKYRNGAAKVGEALNVAKWLAQELKKALAGYEDMLALADREEAYHRSQSDLSLEACATALVISQNEDEREDRLIIVTAILEALQEELARRLEGDLSESDRTRLNMVSMLVVARLKNMRPMIQDANGAVKMFAVNSNANALTAMDQFDFATYGLAAWRRNIASEILSRANTAMNFAYLDAINFTHEQAEQTFDAFDEQVTSLAAVLQSQLETLDLLTRMTDSLVNAGETLATALEKAQDQSEAATRVIGGSKQKIAASEQKLSAEVARILKKGK